MVPVLVSAVIKQVFCYTSWPESGPQRPKIVVQESNKTELIQLFDIEKPLVLDIPKQPAQLRRLEVPAPAISQHNLPLAQETRKLDWYG